ncbi:MAG TPA: DUF1127 domain-containing protein [Geminicoccaceae bacterium]|nr:DUF1127 domain-containing protein [Geminicoccaceae bacterium]
MHLLHRITRYLEAKRLEGDIHQQLARLDDRCLADIGLARGDIAGFAQAAARRDVPPVADDFPAEAAGGLLVGPALGLRAV